MPSTCRTRRWPTCSTRSAATSDDADVKAFIAAGFSRDQVFEVIAGVAISMMENYAGNVANPPLEAPFQAHAWSR
jgi:alkylhydroperoxidase family enzyme